MSTNEKMLTVNEAAMRIGMSARHVRRLVAERAIPFYKVGRSVRISATDIDAYLGYLRVEALQGYAAFRGVA